MLSAGRDRSESGSSHARTASSSPPSTIVSARAVFCIKSTTRGNILSLLTAGRPSSFCSRSSSAARSMSFRRVATASSLSISKSSSSCCFFLRPFVPAGFLTIADSRLAKSFRRPVWRARSGRQRGRANRASCRA